MPFLRLAVAIGLLLTLVTEASAQVYRWRDADGVVHYSDRKPAEGEVERVAVDTRQPEPPAPAAVGGPERATATPPEPPKKQQRFDVVMYGRPDCGYCVRAERYFQKNGLAYQSLNVKSSKSARERFEKLGGRGTPLIFIAGQRINGYNAERMDAMLASLGW